MLENVRGFYNGYLLDQGNLWEYCWLVVSPWHRTPSCPCPNLFPSLFFLISQALKPKIYTILQNILISGLATTFPWLYFWIYLYEVQIHYSVGTTCWLDCSHFCSWQRRLWVPDRSPNRRWQKRDPDCYQVRRIHLHSLSTKVDHLLFCDATAVLWVSSDFQSVSSRPWFLPLCSGRHWGPYLWSLSQAWGPGVH